VHFPAISRCRAAKNLPDKELKLSERSEFFNSRQIQAAQGNRPKVDQVIGCLFWFVFGQAKMNE
jgi:hypothetical protein